MLEEEEHPGGPRGMPEKVSPSHGSAQTVHKESGFLARAVLRGHWRHAGTPSKQEEEAGLEAVGNRSLVNPAVSKAAKD